MNDFDPSLDEIVSAYVDGVATPDERARVEADPTLVERAATFRRLQSALAATPGPASDEQRNALISRALSYSAPVHNIRARRYEMAGPIAAAAAIIAVLFGLGTLLVAAQDGGDSDSASTAAVTVRDADAFGAAESADAPKSLGAAATTAGANAGQAAAAPSGDTSAKTPVFLGVFNDESTLRQALLSARSTTNSATTTTQPTAATRSAATPPSSCPATDLVDPTIYSADLRGRPVTILVAGTRADVIDNATCARSSIDLGR